MGMIIVPTGLVGGAVSWSAWDESSEATLASDDTFVVFFEGGASANETGLGGDLSVANRLVQQGGGVPGVSGGYRQLTAASSQYFAWVGAAADLMIKDQTEFTIIMKCKDWATVATASDPINKFDVNFFGLISTTSKLRFIYGPTVGTSDVTSANVVPNTGVVYFAIWRKAGAVKAAFKATTRPVLTTDFAAGDTCTSTRSEVYNRAFPASPYLFTDTARWATIKVAYIVVAKKALFN